MIDRTFLACALLGLAILTLERACLDASDAKNECELRGGRLEVSGLGLRCAERNPGSAPGRP